MSTPENSVLHITFQPITERNLDQLKILNGVIFPINYQVSSIILPEIPEGC